jgi:Outer membrane lipoprotein-sorting protein
MSARRTAAGCRTRARRGLALSALLLIVSGAAAGTGREILEQAQARNGFSTWHDRKSLVTLEGFDGEEKRVTRDAQVYERTDPRGEHRTLMEFVSPADFAGTRYLHVSPRRARQEWWMWTPATRRARKLGGTYPGLQRDEIFFGTDLSYSDLVLLVRIQQWTAAEGTATLEGEDACGEQTCDRIVLVPARDNAEFPCARYRLWFSRDDRLLRKAELYDPESQLMKTVTCDGYFASGRFMTARTCVIEHVKTRTRSRITVREIAYDTGLGDDLFTVAHLSEGG